MPRDPAPRLTPISTRRPYDSVVGRLAGTAGLRIAGMSLAFLANIFLARTLGVKEFGNLAYILAWIAVFKVLTTFGLDRLLVMETAVCRLNSTWGVLRGLMRWSLAIPALMAAAITAIVWIIRPQSIGILAVAGVFLLTTSILRLLCAELQGMGIIVTSQLAEGLIQPGLYLLFLVPCWLLLRPNFGGVTAIGMGAISAAIACLFSGWLIVRKFPKEAFSSPAQYLPGRWLILALPLVLVGILDTMNSQVSSLTLGSMAGSTALGVYSAADKLAQLVAFPLVVVNVVLAPSFAELFHGGKRRELQDLVTRSSIFIFVSSIAIAAVLMAGSTLFLRIFGEDFAAGRIPLFILCLGQLANAFLGSVAYLLIMTGHGKEASIGIAIGALANLSLSLLLVPLWGTLGAAVASATGLTIWNIALAVFVRRRLGILTTAVRFDISKQA